MDKLVRTCAIAVLDRTGGEWDSERIDKNIQQYQTGLIAIK